GIGTPFGAPGGQTCDQFKVSLTLKHSGGSPTADLSEPMLTVVEVPLAHLGSDLLVLIGADMLARCQLHYDGPAATFSLQY
ncbi:MAG TPA: hypothetical protein VG013_10010, partial [Gemmataceae bacterium]|nr:hypothetical protein [Gemmataceae bacterium]